MNCTGQELELDEEDECMHDDRDHGICINCGHEEDPGEAIDRAMSIWEEK